MTTTVAANCISQPIVAPRGALVTVTPAVGGTAKVEYTSIDNAPAVRSGTATWTAWPFGTVSTAASDLLGESSYIRVTAYGGAATLNVDERPADDKLRGVRRDWNSLERLPGSGNTLGVIGDSRDDQAFPLPVSSGSSYYTYVNAYRSLKWALGLSGQCFRRVVDLSLSGSGMGVVSNTANLHPTFPEQMAAVLAAAPAYCWIRVPINDFFGGAEVEQVWPPFKLLVDTVLAAGIRVELVASTLMDSTKPSYSAITQAKIIKLNDLVRAEYGSNGGLGVVFHDTAAVAMQPGVTTYAGVTGAYADNVHFQNVGAYLEGSMIARNWLSRFKPLPLLGSYAGDAVRGVPANASSYGALLNMGSSQLLSNNMFDLGTPVSGLGQGWAVLTAVDCTYTASIVAAPEWDGNTNGKGQQLAVEFTAPNGYIVLESPNMFSDLQLMKKYMAAALITLAPGAVNFKTVRVELLASSNLSISAAYGASSTGDGAIAAFGTSGGNEVALCEFDLADYPTLAQSGGGQYFRLKFTIAAGAGATGNATVTLSRAAVRVVD